MWKMNERNINDYPLSEGSPLNARNLNDMVFDASMWLFPKKATFFK